MLKFITEKSEVGVNSLATRIAELLNAGKKVLWLVSGGSNIALEVDILNKVRVGVKLDKLGLLTISQTDERYGPVGHPDSNWQQMKDVGFDFKGVVALPALTNLSTVQTVDRWSNEIEQAFNGSDTIVAQFGIGADGHIAGILPHSKAIGARSKEEGVKSAIAYEAPPFIRITLTPAILTKVNEAYVFAYGDSKKKTLQDLRDRDLPIDEQPAQILKSLPEVSIYTDA